MEETNSIVWRAIYQDGRLVGQVIRSEHYHGVLQVVEAGSGTVLYEVHVGYIYEGMFGPDQHDYAEWREQVTQWIQVHR